jgi:hypothetical protein
VNGTIGSYGMSEKIAEDFVGNETTQQTKDKLTSILTFWGKDPSSYVTWGDVRVDLNDLLEGTSSGIIADTELANTFLPKINLCNNVDQIVAEKPDLADLITEP